MNLARLPFRSASASGGPAVTEKTTSKTSPGWTKLGVPLAAFDPSATLKADTPPTVTVEALIWSAGSVLSDPGKENWALLSNVEPSGSTSYRVEFAVTAPAGKCTVRRKQTWSPSP